MTRSQGRPRRVIHFLEASGGGVLSVVLDSVKTLMGEFPGKFEFTVIYSERKETPPDLERCHPEIEFIKLDVGRLFFSPRDILLAAKIARISRRFDVLHCHSSRAGFIGRMSRLFGSCKRILYSPHCYAFLSEEFSGTKRASVFLVERLLAYVPGTLTVACGDSELQLARKVGGNSTLVRNGYFSEGSVATVSGEKWPVVIGVGRDSLQKDPDVFLEIASGFSPDEARFSWIGAFRDEPISTGWVSRERSAELIARSDIFLMTSRWEGLPISGLEAMATGKPLVVRDVPGARDLVEHGKNGFLFASVQEATSYLRRLADDPSLRAEMGMRSLELLSSKFSSGNYLALADIYS